MARAASAAEEASGRYAKAPFGSPERVLTYLGRYTHRVAIANSRLGRADVTGVTFRSAGATTATATHCAP
ncbi:hypothetical protein GOL95_31905 [Sinorhizobium medicae]|nr:hypothetical protein [Sinorhizobium medicae]MDX1244460.1 hypothetical protein [Sinorhizobium medicae]